MIAMTLSVRTYHSTQFVLLERPIRVSPYLKSIKYVGLRSWELCSLKQDALNKIIDQVGEGYAGETTAPINTELQSRALMKKDMHNDTLAAGYPYNDDDEFQASFPEDFWSCHTLRFDSKSITNDRLWVLARFFFMLGTVIGFIATCLLALLLLIDAKDVDERLMHYSDTLKSSSEESKEQSIAYCERTIDALETPTSGCREISACFLLAYLIQCLTLLFLNGRVCVSQKCSLSSGARSLITACILWIVNALLLILMMQKERRNQHKLQQQRRRNSIPKKQKTQEDIEAGRENNGDDILTLTLDTTGSRTASDE